MTRLTVYHLGQMSLNLWQQPATLERDFKLALIRAIFEQWRQQCK